MNSQDEHKAKELKVGDQISGKLVSIFVVGSHEKTDGEKTKFVAKVWLGGENDTKASNTANNVAGYLKRVHHQEFVVERYFAINTDDGKYIVLSDKVICEVALPTSLEEVVMEELEKKLTPEEMWVLKDKGFKR